jgi:tRNA(fMet)-specific endonuclease VapC
VRCLIDTSAYSAFRRNNRDVVDYLNRAEAVYVNPIVTGELRAGFLAGTRQVENEGMLLRFLSAAGTSTLPIDDETGVRYAHVREYLRGEGKPIPENDLWIVATAFQHGLRLLTLDRHFTRLPQIIVDLIEPERA